VQLQGNTNYPSNNPFPCNCAVSASSFSFTASSSYVPGNCTRHIFSGMDPFISVRLDAPTNSYIACFFPGFLVPSSGGGSSIYVNFYWNPMHFFNAQSLPSPLYSPYMKQSGSVGLTSTGTSNSMYSYN
jgi:hypothetical protein